MNRAMNKEEIKEFIEGVGARELAYGDVLYRTVRTYNYFMLNAYFLIVKIYHGPSPFYGLRRGYLEKLNDWDGQFYLILLLSANEGWVYGKDEVNYNINNGSWKYGQGGEYKIPNRLRDVNYFTSHEDFLKIIGIETKK